jgi:hypothetical protein
VLLKSDLDDPPVVDSLFSIDDEFKIWIFKLILLSYSKYKREGDIHKNFLWSSYNFI